MADPMVLLSVEEAITLSTQILTRHGASLENAEATARALVEAEARGQKGHGLSRLPTYAGQLRSGKVDGQADPEILYQNKGALRIDARHGFAYPALDFAVDELVPMVHTNHVASASITRSHHAGALGIYVEKLAARGLVALMFANTPKAIAPYGGKNAVYGTNPIGFAAPRQDAPPIVIDLALSKTARGKINAAAQKGEAIPEGWALDKDGNPTTDAKAALEGTMLPIGDAKGTALALMVEILAVALTGANPSASASSFLNESGAAPGTGQFLIAINPEALSGGLFMTQIDAIIDTIEGEAGTRLPGESARKAQAKVKSENGFRMSSDEYDALKALLRT